MLAVSPVFNPALATIGSAEINRIRIVAYLAGTDSILGQTIQDVNAQASEWTLDFSIVAPTGGSAQVLLTVELINVGGGGEKVEWSGRVGPMRVLPGSTPRIQNVGVVRGPLGNLSVTAVSIQGPIEDLLEQGSVQLSATAATSDPNVQPQLFWSSLEPGVATVSGQGLLTGIASGTARIVATAGAVADTAQVEVLARPGDVEITPGSALIQALGDEVAFSAAVMDSRGTAMPSEPVIWAVEAPGILEDLGNGRYRALSRGTTVVTVSSASAPEVTSSARVVVQQAVASVEVLPEGRTLTARGDTLRFTAQAFDGNGNPIVGMPFSWSTSNTQVATVDAAGLLTAVNTGVVTVSARAGADPLTTAPQAVAIPGLVGQTTLTVDRTVDRVEIRPATHTFTSISEGLVLTALALDANGYAVDGQSFTWNSSDTAVATVTGTGLAVAVGDGQSIITAATGGLQGSSTITVNQTARSLRWVAQPSDGSPGVALDPPPAVEVLDEVGSRVTSFSGTVELQAIMQPLVGAPVGTILGSPSETATAGLAVFPDVAIESTGAYILVARSGSMVPAPSEEFIIGSAEVADLKVIKTVGAATAVEGDMVTFTISVENLGPDDATSVVLEDPLPTGLELEDWSVEPFGTVYDEGTGLWEVGALPAGSSAILYIDAFVAAGTAGSTLTNIGSVLAMDQTDPDPSNDASSASVEVTVSPVNWNGVALGNTELIVGSYPPPTSPYVLATGDNLLGPTPTLSITAPGTYATVQGGTVTLEVDGDFSYTPPIGFSGVDAFGFSAGGGSASAYITVSDMVWYVDNTNPAAGTGLSNDPFQTLVQAEAATALPANPDRIYLHYGDGTPYQGGITLRDSQILDGEGFGLTDPAWPDLMNTGPGSAPIITNASGVGVWMTAGSVLRGVNIVNTSSQAIYSTGIGGGTVEDVNISGSAMGIYSYFTSGTFDFVNVNITDVSDRAIWIYDGDPTFNFQGAVDLTAPHNQLFTVSGTTGGSVTLSGGPFVDSGSSLQSVLISTAQGPVTVSGPLTITGPGGGGISLTTNQAPVTFDQVSITTTGSAGISVSNSPALTTITSGSVNVTNQLGLTVNNSPFSGTFSEMIVNNLTGVGGGVYMWGSAPGTTNFTRLQIQTTAPSGGAQFVNAGTVNVTDGSTSSIVGTGVQAISVVNTDIDMSFATLTSLDPSSGGVANGAYFFDATGAFTATGGNLFNPQNVDGTSLKVVGGDADITYGGQIRNLQPDAWAVQVGGRTGGTVTVNGFVEDSGRGIQIGGTAGANLGGSVAFNGGMSLIGPGAAGAPPFYAYAPAANGTLEITGTNNTIAAPLGLPVLEITNTTIGPAGVTFRQVQGDGDYTASDGVKLENTGSGPFSITGDGATGGSGGYVDNMGQNGFNLRNTGPVSLSFMGVAGNLQTGILGVGVGGLQVVNSSFFGAAGMQGINIEDLTGTSLISGSSFSNANGPILLQVTNFLTNSFTMDIDNSSFTVGNPAGSTAALFTTFNDASGVVNVRGGSSFTNSGAGLNMSAYDNSVLDLNVSEASSFSNNLRGMYLYQGQGATLKFDIQNAQILNNATYGVYAASLIGALAGGELTGQFLNSEVRNNVDGLFFHYQAESGGYLRFRDNVIDPLDGAGIFLQNGAVGGPTAASVGVEATGNSFTVDLTGPAIDFRNYGNTTLCAAIDTNTVFVGDGDYLFLTQGESTSIFNLEGLNGGTGFVSDPATVGAFVDATNTLLGGGSTNAFLNTGMNGVPAGTCVPPIL